MKTSDLDYELPPERIAQAPLPERDASRLLCVDLCTGSVTHRSIRDLPGLLKPSLITLNDTRVIPARIFGRKPTGGRVEFLLVRRLSEVGNDETWLALAKPAKGLRPGYEIDAAGGELLMTVEEREDSGQFRVRLRADEPVRNVVARHGLVPLPPYIRRQPVPEDAERYQTVYAENEGAVAAPTAGLHLTEPLLETLEQQGHRLCRLTLHVGPGTFLPVRGESLDGHDMHSERYDVPAATAAAIGQARQEHRQVLAVGTTVVRALESAAIDAPPGEVAPGPQSTSLFIRPPYQFRAVDALLTNFHLPRSTLLALVMAFAGVDLIRAAYVEAVKEGYRFYSYGDAMLLHGREAD